MLSLHRGLHILLALALYVFSFCDNAAGCSRYDTVYKGLNLPKNEADGITRSATLTSSTAVTSHKNYYESVDKSPKLRRLCLSHDDRLSFTSGPCRRLGNCSSSSCTGHVVSLRARADDDVTTSTPTPHDRLSSSLEGCRSLSSGLSFSLKPSPPSLIQSPGVYPSSKRGPSTTAAAVAASAFQRRLFLEALRSPPTHGYIDTATCDKNSAVSDLVAAPSASYAAASAAAVLGTQLAIHAWFRTALDTRTSPLRLTPDFSYMPQQAQSGQDWIQPLNTSSMPLTLREVARNSSSPCRPDDMEEDTCDVASALDESSRPSTELSHMEQMVSELDDDHWQQSPSPEPT